MSRASNASRSSRVESLKRFELGLAAVAFCVCGGLAVLFLLFGELEGASWKILTTAVVFGLYSLLALPGARLLDQGRSSILAWSAVLLAALGLLWAFRIVWSGLDDADGSWRLLVTLTACSTAVSQVCATTARRRPILPPLTASTLSQTCSSIRSPESSRWQVGTQSARARSSGERSESLPRWTCFRSFSSRCSGAVRA
jgi:hypothetical protein